MELELFQIFYFEFINLKTISKYIAVTFIILEAQSKFCLLFIKIDRILFLSGFSNPCAGLPPGIKISLFLLSKWTHELISTPNIITFYQSYYNFFSKIQFQVSNSMLKPLYLYLSGSIFLTNLAGPNKELFNRKSTPILSYLYYHTFANLSISLWNNTIKLA